MTPVKRGDNITLTRKVKSRGPGSDIIIDKPPRMTLNRLAEMFIDFKKVVEDYIKSHP
ncbi:MAG: hypothetical protein LBJ97_00980 [Mycoplasmataceae bacterium]|jgi:hypothetical protein|nr:hypothetical protein [Mycoplasmataceae bacterium]